MGKIEKPKRMIEMLLNTFKIIGIDRVVVSGELLQELKIFIQEISGKPSKIIEIWSLFAKTKIKDNFASFDRINLIFDSQKPQIFALKEIWGCR